MGIEWSISIGNILTAVGLAITLYTIHAQAIRRLDKIETQLEMMYEWFTRKVINRVDDQD